MLPDVPGDNAAPAGQTVDRHILFGQGCRLGQKLQPGHVQPGTAAEKQQADGPRGAAQVDAPGRGGSIHKIRQQHAVGAQPEMLRLTKQRPAGPERFKISHGFLQKVKKE